MCPTIMYHLEFDGYAMLATCVSLYDIPLILDPARLDKSSGIEETLRRNKAVYHCSSQHLFTRSVKVPMKVPLRLKEAPV